MLPWILQGYSLGLMFYEPQVWCHEGLFCVAVSPIHCLTLDKQKEVWLPNENREMGWP